jgi:putative salt-induced outer membrane protein YdiY
MRAGAFRQRMIEAFRMTGRHLMLALLSTGLALPALAQAIPTSDERNQESELRVHLDLDETCAAEVRAAVQFVEWVITPEEADVLVNRVPVDDEVEGAPVIGRLTGRGRFEGRTDALRAQAAIGGEQDGCPGRLAHAVQLGLVSYAAATPLAAHLQVVYVPPAESRASDGADAPSPAATAPAPSRPAAARRTNRPQDGRWAAAVDLGFTSASGNTDLMALNSGLRLRHRQTSRFRLDWTSNIRYGESGGEVVARQLQSSLNFDLGPDARFAPFLSASAERDRFRKLDVRSKVGAGMRYGLHKNPQGQASVRLAALYTYEQFAPDADRPARYDGAWSLTVNGNQRLGENVQIASTSNFDPVMGDLGDYNLEVKSTLSTKMTSNLALTLGHNYAYDSTPVADVRRADQRFQAGLTVEF